MQSDQKALLKALDKFEAKQKVKGGKMTAPVDVCATYALVKPILAYTVGFLGFIPGIGPRIATAIRALMSALDVFCPKS